MVYTCSCGKKFQRINAFKRHRGICEILREKTHIQKKELEESSDIPPLDEMWLIIKTLVEENDKLKKEIKKMRANIGIQNKRIKVLDWLNINIKPKIDYENWLNTFDIVEKDLSNIFEMGFINGMINILENINKENIKAYNQKPNKLYIYRNSEWNILDLYDFKTLISKIQRKLLQHFIKWSNNNQEIVFDHQSNEYANKTKEIMGGSKTFSATIKPIHNKFYRSIKTDFKDELNKLI